MGEREAVVQRVYEDRFPDEVAILFTGYAQVYRIRRADPSFYRWMQMVRTSLNDKKPLRFGCVPGYPTLTTLEWA